MTPHEELSEVCRILGTLSSGDMRAAAALCESAASVLPSLPEHQREALLPQVRHGLELAVSAAAFFEAKLARLQKSGGELQPSVWLSC